MCDCLKISFIVTGDPAGLQTIEVETNGTLNGYNTYQYTYLGITYYIWHDNSDNWIVNTTGFGIAGGIVTTLKVNTDQCPLAESPVWTPQGHFDYYKTEGCPCPCITLRYSGHNSGSDTLLLSSEGIYNTFNYFSFYVEPLIGVPTTFYLWYDSLTSTWIISDILGGGITYMHYESESPCPLGSYVQDEPFFQKVDVTPWDCCKRKEERVFREYLSVKLPEIFEEQDRGWFKCCEPNLVLAHPFDSETWKNDVTSAWIKLSDPSDTATIELLKNGQPTSYPNILLPIVNEPNAFYRTIYWQEVLNSDGEGCYSIVVTFSIGGMSGTFTWGIYNLVQYSIHNALKTARIRVKFNLKHEIEGINFKDSNVEDSIRFYGFIGDRQPNMEFDNLIYQDRNVRSVVRENLNQYEISTDACSDEITRKMTDLYLLSENEMWISDYNAHNHSYRYLDIPVIVEDSPEIDYLDRWQRKAVLKCKVGDKQKNKRTYY